METFAIRDLSFSYPEQETKALDGLSLRVPQGAFLVLCGPSGCGKSTLLRQLKTVLAPHGDRTGTVLFEGTPLEQLDLRAQSRKIGFVQQDPESQVVTDKVWHELAFGLESLGCDTPTIRRRVAEMASFFGIQNWFYQNVNELSGGQKQLLNLASVMVMQPSVLILDEPTSQLDPIAASDFLAALGRINRELGTTIILTEHRLEDAFPLATDVAVMDRGRLVCAGSPGQVGAELKDGDPAMFLAMPTAMRVWAAVEDRGECPVTVREGRDWLAGYAADHPLRELPPEPCPGCPGETVLEARDLWFKYEKDMPDVVKGLNLSVRRGEFLALLGGNGTGKSTSLKLMAGLLRPYRGQLRRTGRVGVLPQNPQTLFVKKTVREDLFEVFRGREDSPSGREARVAGTVRLCGLEELLDRHPYDLSGGEQQRAALAKVLLLEPDILLLDEPTKGLDAEFKQRFGEILEALLRRGTAVLMVSHDIEFCACRAYRCALLFDGSIVTEGPPRRFFSGNSFYTTAANRMARGLVPEAVTAGDVIAACGGKLPPAPALPEDSRPLPEPEEGPEGAAPGPLPRWRKLLAAVSGLVTAVLFLHILGVTDLTALIAPEGATSLAGGQLRLYGGMLLSLLVFALSVSRRSCPPEHLAPKPAEKRALSKRTMAAALILLLIPLTLFVGETYLGGRKYYFISLLILLECMLPFFLVFEHRKPQARELVVIAVLCAIGVAGRAAFFMLPQFKPVIALTIIAGVAFGGETGFLVGAMTMLVSNILFGQGPWTPWQMFAMGIIGFLAGVLFRRGWLRRSRGSLCVFGALAAVLVYGGIMNLASALLWAGELNGKIILAYYISGFPVDCIQAAATALFLWFAAEPMLEKMDRLKVKYGLIR
ncbi:ECF transporter S component [Pseudoflavonifractor phocaeensis]|uniref:ECF transporter S component n=1 Tax=Pseudoflavonifractor phocaeensis TaxID=1870988 RepID=UPI001F3B2447|nr:ECF transporter S component [Pseudoflavonifractor phocaeensis]MCF2661631.1 ATP-binding cassette domain-containing protein [Pseudoflavonifractor phocaeensis]